MSKSNAFLLLPIVLVLAGGCKKNDNPAESAAKPGSYAYDVEFLRRYSKGLIELSNNEGLQKVLVSARYQGRVMTSTATGDEGASYGWINYKLIASGEIKAQFNPVGGEERFWLGPEGGQYSVYFHPGDSFDVTHWQVPALIDTMTYDIVRSNATEALFSKRATLKNYSGTIFDILIERKITLLDKGQLEAELNTSLPEKVQVVGYQSSNRLQNTGDSDWKKESGLLSIWLLGMLTPSEDTMVIIPFSPQKNGPSLITTDYFGKIPPERLTIKDSVLYFTCDGKYRSKIGLPSTIAKPVAGSFDFQKNILTITLFTVAKTVAYVNSKWEIQKEPYRGDVVNSYNDGPLENGTQLGPFYELESSSPALELKGGESGIFGQTTCHFEGDFESLNTLAKKLLGVDLSEMKN